MMVISKWKVASVVVFSIVCLAVAFGQIEQFKEALEIRRIPIELSDVLVLHGLKELKVVGNVLVEKLPDGFEQAGVSARDIRTQVELRLRQSGLKITNSLFLPPEYVYARVSGLPIKNLLGVQTGWVYVIELRIVQPAYLERLTNEGKRIRCYASTYDSSWIGICGLQDLRSAIREGIDRALDELINDWLKENGK